jgi:hypothetical protein
MKKIFSKNPVGIHHTKNFFEVKYFNLYVVFDGDYEFDIIFVEKCNKKSSKCKIRAPLHIKIP